MPEPVLEWSALSEGRVFAAVPLVLDDSRVDAYLEATGEHHPLYAHATGGGWVPPCFTTMVRFAKDALGGRWPSGTIQLDHRLSMRRALRRGESLTLDARCVRIDEWKGRPRFEILSTLRDAAGDVAGTQSSSSLWGGSPPIRVAAEPGRPASTTATEAGAPQGGQGASVVNGGPMTAPQHRYGALIDRYPMARVRAFGEVARALDPIHVDPEFARGTPYGANIVQGRLVMTLVSRLMLDRHGSRWLKGGHFTVRFVRPVRVDETVSAWAQPLAGRPGSFAVWCENVRGERVIDGEAGIGS